MSAFTDMIGNDAESAYENVLGINATRRGGVGDGGVDIEIKEDSGNVILLQVKSSPVHAEKFWATSILRKKQDSRFIRLAVGAPGTKEETLAAIKRDGFWVGQDVPNRDACAARLRTLRKHLIG